MISKNIRFPFKVLLFLIAFALSGCSYFEKSEITEEYPIYKCNRGTPIEEDICWNEKYIPQEVFQNLDQAYRKEEIVRFFTIMTYKFYPEYALKKTEEILTETIKIPQNGSVISENMIKIMVESLGTMSYQQKELNEKALREGKIGNIYMAQDSQLTSEDIKRLYPFTDSNTFTMLFFDEENNKISPMGMIRNTIKMVSKLKTLSENGKALIDGVIGIDFDIFEFMNNYEKKLEDKNINCTDIYQKLPNEEIKMTVSNLYNQYELNSFLLEENLKNTVFEISGEIQNIEKIENGIGISLKGYESKKSALCLLPESESPKVAKIKKGDIITLGAKYKDKNNSQLILDCKIKYCK